MKTCKYCAEEIQDAAIKCRWCQSWLIDDVPSGAHKAPSKSEGKGQSSKVEPPKAEEPKPEPPKAEEPKPEPPKAEEPKAEEPKPVPAAQATMMAPVPVAKPQPIPEPEPAPQPTPQPQAAPAAQAQPAQAAPAAQEAKIEFTHSGSRYLLGYAPDFFGIWDRNAPRQPVERFPRNDDGWGAAWARYAQIESNWLDLRSGQKSG